MFLMNWHSVGFKVVAINMTIVTLLSVSFLIYFAQLEKQKLIERKIEYSRQLLLISESVRDGNRLAPHSNTSNLSKKMKSYIRI